MRRQRITQAAKDFLAEFKGQVGAGSPFAWDMIVTQAANDVAVRLGCYYDLVARPIASGVSDYSPATIYSPTRVAAQDGNGNTIYLDPMTVSDLNQWGVIEGFVTATGAYTAGIPSSYIWLAANKIRLIPVPNYAAPGGLTIEGLGYPGESWPEPQDDCPLPQYTHTAVVYRAAVLRSTQFAGPDNKARTDQIGSVYEREITAAKQMQALMGENAANATVRGGPGAALPAGGAV